VSRVSAAPPPDAVPPEEIRRVRGLLDTATRVVVLTGAGISTDSGIPDFRGPQGVWTRDPAAERTSDISHYLADPEVRALAWQGRLHHPVWEASPNAGHRALVALEERGTLHLLITQNIDGLHQQAGSDPAGVVEVHGTVHRVVCLRCEQRWPMAHALDRVRAGEVDPACVECGGILKSDTISFGQSLVEADLERAFRAAGEADLLLAVGSTLTVYPIAAVPEIAAAAGARVVVVNGSPTQYDDRADAVLRGPISEILPALLA
jgi:NAD-dependent deacetylase